MRTIGPAKTSRRTTSTSVPAIVMPTTSMISLRSWRTEPDANRRAANGSRTKLTGVRAEPIMLTAATPNATRPATRMSAAWATRIPGIAKRRSWTTSPGTRGMPNRASSRMRSRRWAVVSGSRASGTSDTTVQATPIATRIPLTEFPNRTIESTGTMTWLTAINTFAFWILARPRR